MSRAGSLSLIWLLWVGPSPAWCQELVAEPEPDIAEIRFGWTPGTKIEVAVHSRQVREEPAGNSDMVSEGTYSIRVAEHPQGILVMPDDFRTTHFESNPPIPRENPLWMLYNELGDVTPHYVVSPEGALVGVEGIEQIAARVRGVVGPLLDSAPEDAVGLRRMIDRMLSEQVLFQEIEQQWNAMVGTWVGADFEIGASYVLEQDVPSPLIPQLSVPMRYVFSAAERTYCVEGGPEDECVYLVMESYPDEDRLAELLIEFVNRAAEGVAEPDLVFTRLQQENTILLVAEPDTLLPHELEMTTDISGTVTENGEASTFRRLEEARYLFTYE